MLNLPQAFLEKVDAFIVQKEYRLQVLGLLCSYVRLQGPHLYQVLQTPLLDHLLQCLENDSSTTVISLALTVLIMFMPHLCNSLAAYLPRLFIVYTRVLCWDKFGIGRIGDGKIIRRGGAAIVHGVGISGRNMNFSVARTTPVNGFGTKQQRRFLRITVGE